ncbi:MAG: FecR domain-containing protein [Saprospiraceae bacterium]|nr:FecR domain-containing protein [Saprospiraceae bacterium]
MTLPEDPASRRSFNIYLGIIIVIMLITGVMALVDIWHGDVVESTELGEERQLRLPDGTQVTLQQSSELTFHKGDPQELRLQGSAIFNTQNREVKTKDLEVETMDLTVEAGSARFSMAYSDRTSVEVLAGQVTVVLKPDGYEKVLEAGDSISHRHQP